MTLTLPDHIESLRDITAEEMRRELALALYASQKLTLIQAADLAGLGFFEFQHLLRDRKIPQNYDEHDLEQDLNTLHKLRSK